VSASESGEARPMCGCVCRRPRKGLARRAPAGRYTARTADAARPVREVLDERQQCGIGPMQVLDHDHERIGGRDSLEEAPPSRERLLALRRFRLLAEARERSQADSQPVALRLLLDHGRDRVHELGGGLVRGVVLNDPGMDFTTSPRPDVIPRTGGIGLAASIRDREVVHESQELAHQARLPTPGSPVSVTSCGAVRERPAGTGPRGASARSRGRSAAS
jgi:hypothetical protein